MLEDAHSEIKCTDTFYLQNVLVHFWSSLPERSFLLTQKRWGEVCCHWRYILVGGIFLLVVYSGCCWIVVSGKSKFVGSSVLSVISWLLLCVPLDLPFEYNYVKLHLNPGPQAISIIWYHLWILLQQVMSSRLLWFVLAAAVDSSSHDSTMRDYYLLWILPSL